MTADTLKSLYQFSLRALRMNLEGISHEDSLVAPQPGGNCINWALGHIVANRGDILALVGEAPVWSEEEARPYLRGSAPLARERARPFDEIVADLEGSQERLLAGIGRLSESELTVGEPGRTLQDRLLFFAFHEGYHTGQIGILRRVAGKEGAIR